MLFHLPVAVKLNKIIHFKIIEAEIVFFFLIIKLFVALYFDETVSFKLCYIILYFTAKKKNNLLLHFLSTDLFSDLKVGACV